MTSTVEYSFDRPIPIEALKVLFLQTTWARDRNEDDIAEIIAKSAVQLGTWQENRLVGYARVLTDGRFRALIDDVIVDETCRGRGLGREIMEHLLVRLTRVEEVFLLANESMALYYEHLGFTRTAANCLMWPK
ncbi:GNAT family N-acetyltransferase [Rhizobium lentis]|uniref:GNAT family N-acetyltransferase n=1 Tax=Rhizobium lentis TaxID=1138194 RepID=UPI001C8382B0|nr:GNAT family N-acetyltransferase [Rhizobium lentis]MBX5154508.1 GNAT family N-acetyltransferase [Rhizobium lentis]